MKGFKQQALQVALCATWLAGLLFIAFSLYATQLLPSSSMDKGQREKQKGSSISIYTVPAPFDGFIGDRQSLAVHSWLRLSSCIHVILFGHHPSLHSFAQSLHHRVEVDSQIDFTFLGVPLFHSMIARARESSSDISVLIDPEFILLPDFIHTLEHVENLEHDWLLMAIARGISYFPFSLQVFKGTWEDENGYSVRDEQVQSYVQEKGYCTNCTGKYLWAWNTGKVPLHAGIMPPFVYGHGLHNEWLLNEALSSSLRFVIDVSDAMTMFSLSSSDLYFGNTCVIKNDFGEQEINSHLAAVYGSFYLKPIHFLNAPVRLTRCESMNSICLRFLLPAIEFNISTSERMIPSAMLQGSPDKKLLNGEFLSSFRRSSIARKHFGFAMYRCSSVKTIIERPGGFSLRQFMMPRWKVSCHCNDAMDERNLECPISKLMLALKPVASLSVPLSLDTILTKVAKANKVVVLAVVGNNYRDMLMSWVCRMRNLNISNYIVAAVDAEIYEFALLQGLPVFKHGLAMKLSLNNCHFGTECFKKVTKVKSRVVLQILQLGYNILLSDVDVYWFKDPIKYLMSFGPKTLAAQSDQWNETEPSNVPRRLNSGFYFAWSNNSTIEVFKKIVKHADTSNMSEQPSFYDVLCGKGGRYRIGDDSCMEPETNITVKFLDPLKFPNGAFRQLWEMKNVTGECQHQGCFVLHNNWVNSRQKKLERQHNSGLWDYDVKNRMCSRSWQGLKSSHSF